MLNALRMRNSFLKHYYAQDLRFEMITDWERNLALSALMGNFAECMTLSTAPWHLRKVQVKQRRRLQFQASQKCMQLWHKSELTLLFFLFRVV